MATQQTTLRAAQIISLALIAGVATFAAVVLVLLLGAPAPPSPAGPPPPSPPVATRPDLVTALAIAVGALAIASIVVPIAMGAASARQARTRFEGSARDETALAGASSAYATLGIIRAAVAEGMGLLAVVSALVTGEPLFLLGGAFSVLLMAAMFPTAAREREFLRRATDAEPARPFGA